MKKIALAAMLPFIIAGCASPLRGTYEDATTGTIIMIDNNRFQLLGRQGATYMGSVVVEDQTATLTPQKMMAPEGYPTQASLIKVSSADKFQTFTLEPGGLKFQKKEDWAGEWIPDERWDKEGVAVTVQ